MTDIPLEILKDRLAAIDEQLRQLTLTYNISLGRRTELLELIDCLGKKQEISANTALASEGDAP